MDTIEGQHHKKLPENPAMFRLWRHDFLARINAEADRELTQEAVWRMCRNNMRFFVRVFLEPAIRENESYQEEPVTCPGCHEEVIPIIAG